MMKHRVTSILLAVCMMFCTLPLMNTAALQAETQAETESEHTEPTVQIPEEDGGTVELLEPTEKSIDDCKILQYVDAESFEQADHAFRLPALEELDTYVFQNTDGTRSIYYMHENVKYVDKNGNIREKDLTLKPADCGFTVTENEFDLFLPQSPADGIALTYEGFDVKLTPQNGLETTAEMNGNAVIYDGYFGEHTSLKYTPMLSGVKEEIILETYLPNRSFTFLLETDGLFLVNAHGGYILAESAASTDAVLHLGEILVYDAVGKPSVGTITVMTVEEGEKYLLSVAADEAFLTDPMTVYPVTIDPDLTVKDSSSTAGQIEDAPIFSGLPSANCGTYIYLTAGYTDDTYKIGRSLFRLPGLYNSDTYRNIGSWAHISSVKFYCRDASGNSSRYINLYRCTASWSESAVTWNSFNNSYSTAANWGATMAPNTYTEFDITTLVQNWKKGTYSAASGFILTNPDESTQSNKKAPFSSEYSNTDYRPYVVMTYKTGINLSKTSLTMNIGDTASVAVTSYTPSTSALRWSSSNTRIATVNSTTGLITAKACGKISIKVYLAANSSVYANVTLTVNAPTTQTSGITSGCVYMIKNASTGKYLEADDSTTALTLAQTKDDMSGDQLWYVEWIGNGYKLYSMGVKHKSSYGAYETVWRGVSSSQTPTLASETSSYVNWVINLHNGYYYITNASYKNTSLSAGTSGAVTCNPLSSESGYARWTFEKIELSTFNNYAFGTYSNQTGTVYIQVDPFAGEGDESVFGCENGLVRGDFNIIDEWKNLSSKIVIYNYNDTPQEGITPFVVSYKGYTPEATDDEEAAMRMLTNLGETQGYTKIFGSSVRTDFDADWTSATIYINTCAFSPIVNCSRELAKKAIAHEFGHALKLNHPHDGEYNIIIENGRGAYASVASVCALMNQGAPDTTEDFSATCLTPKWHDIINLRNKWGN